MELRHCRCFVAVAEAESLTVVAERKLHTSQPSLSRQIWVLEDEVGAQLLTRGARGIELTPARRYVKLGFGGAHTDSNQRLMYTSA
jgi:LysR family hca operon transcriptional activator